MKSKHDRCSIGLDGSPDDEVWPEVRSLRPAVETPTITVKDGKGRSERVPSFAIDFADNLL